MLYNWSYYISDRNLIIAGFIINDDTGIVLFAWGLAGVIVGTIMTGTALIDKNINENKTINENSTEIEAVQKHRRNQQQIVL